MDVLRERLDLMEEIRWHLCNREAQEVLNLAQSDQDCNTVGKADHDGDGNEADEATQLEKSHQQKQDA